MQLAAYIGWVPGIPVRLLILLALGAVLVSCEPEETSLGGELGGEAPAYGELPSAPVSSEIESTRSAKNARDATWLVLLGSGTPVPDPRHSGPAVVVLSRGRPYLVDFGPGVVRRAILAQQRGLRELNILNLTRVFVTHLHSDHTAGYPDLILTPAVLGRSEPLQVYGPHGITHMTEALREAFREDLEIRGRNKDPKAMRGYSVEPHEIEPGVVYEDEAVKVTAFKVEHGAWKEAYGYRFDTPDRSIVISGDTRPTNAVIEACNGCDLLVHEVYCKAGLAQAPPRLKLYHATYHTSSVELARIAQKAQPKLLVLYHLLFFGCSEEQLLREVRQEYPGQVALGRDLAVY